MTINAYVLPQTGRTVNAVVTGAKTAFVNSTTAVKLCDAGAKGSLLKQLEAAPRATVANTMLQVYRSPDNGVTMFLLRTEQMAAHTVANATKIPTTEFTSITATKPVRLAAGDSIWVAAAVELASGIVFTGQVEDY